MLGCALLPEGVVADCELLAVPVGAVCSDVEDPASPPEAVLPVVDPVVPVDCWVCAWLVLWSPVVLGVFDDPVLLPVACARPNVLANRLVPRINRPFLIRLLVVSK